MRSFMQKEIKSEMISADMVKSPRETNVFFIQVAVIKGN